MIEITNEDIYDLTKYVSKDETEKYQWSVNDKNITDKVNDWLDDRHITRWQEMTPTQQENFERFLNTLN